MKSFTVQTSKRSEFINITHQVQSAVKAMGIEDGVITVFVPHTTAGITINENADPDVVSDILRALDRLVPWNGDYEHTEGNAAAHVKASLIGSSVRIIVRSGELQLGTWQGIFFCEFDGPRLRHVWVK
jgi:secondary thiamine-phosphate synthase enzyme